MPNYEITSPDGKKFRITAPEGATREQVLAYAKQQFSQNAAPAGPQTPRPPGTAPNLDPMGAFFAGTTDRYNRGVGQALEAAGVTAEVNPNTIPLGFPEAALQGVTGLAGTITGGLAGIGQGIKNRFSPGIDAADRVRQVQQAMTYQPRTAAGQLASGVVGLPARAYEAGTNVVGETVAGVTGSPAAGAAVKTGLDIAPAVIGARGLNRQQAKPRGKVDAGPGKFDVPTTEQLTDASREAYAAGKESGVVVTPENYGKALDSVRKVAKEQGIDPTLHPKTTAVMKRLEESANKELTLQEAETLRKIALDAEDDLNPVTRQPTPDARLAGKVVDQLDQAIEALSVNNDARALWARSRRSQMVDQMIHRAEIRAGAHYTQAGMEHALRQEFKALAMNPRRMRGLTKEQRAAIEKVAKGGPVENTLRALGKFDPSTGGMGTFASIGTGVGLAPYTGGASMALPLVGFGAKRLATRATAKNVDAAREALVGRGIPSGAPRATAPTKQPSAAGAAAGNATNSRPQARSLDSARAEVQRLLAEVQRLQRELDAGDAPQEGGRKGK